MAPSGRALVLVCAMLSASCGIKPMYHKKYKGDRSLTVSNETFGKYDVFIKPAGTDENGLRWGVVESKGSTTFKIKPGRYDVVLRSWVTLVAADVSVDLPFKIVISERPRAVGIDGRLVIVPPSGGGDHGGGDDGETSTPANDDDCVPDGQPKGNGDCCGGMHRWGADDVIVCCSEHRDGCS